MSRIMLKSKIHKARVTSVELDYEGSLEIDEELMELADLLPFEQIQLYNITNGNRLTTYVIKGKRGSGIISVKGAAAHLASCGDQVIIVAFTQVEENELERHTPKILYVNDDNKPLDR